MRRKDMRRKEEDIAKLFKKSLPSAQQEVEAGKRVFYRLLLARAESPAGPLPNDDENGHGRKWLRLSIAIAATTALASFLFIPFLTSGLWETGGNITHTEPSGDPIRRGETVSAGNPEGRMLVLPDGSQVEMRSQSQLQV